MLCQNMPQKVSQFFASPQTIAVALLFCKKFPASNIFFYLHLLKDIKINKIRINKRFANERFLLLYLFEFSLKFWQTAKNSAECKIQTYLKEKIVLEARVIQYLRPRINNMQDFDVYTVLRCLSHHPLSRQLRIDKLCLLEVLLCLFRHL